MDETSCFVVSFTTMSSSYERNSNVITDFTLAFSHDITAPAPRGKGGFAYERGGDARRLG